MKDIERKREQLVILKRARKLARLSHNGAATAEELYELELLRRQIRRLNLFEEYFKSITL